jgi:predicted peptidase
MKIRLAIIVLSLILTMPSQLARSEVLEQTEEFSGISLHFRVILPNDFDPAQRYPTILHFAGGAQNWRIVVNSTNSDWREPAEQNGYIVISPEAPNGDLFFLEDDRVFPEFLDYILQNYPVANNKLHLTGHSNGGLSAFHIASLYPQYFISLTGYPGLLGDRNSEQLNALKDLCIFMHVGDQDPNWRSAMNAQFQALQALEYAISFSVENNQVHRLNVRENDLQARLLNELESARSGCRP